MADLVKDALDGSLKALNNSDPKKFASVYADNALVSVAGLNDINGRSGVEQNMTEWFETFKDVKFGFLARLDSRTRPSSRMGHPTRSTTASSAKKGTEAQIGHHGLRRHAPTSEGQGRVRAPLRRARRGHDAEVAGSANVQLRPIPAVPRAARTSPTGKPEEDKNVDVAKSVLAALEGGKKEADFHGAPRR